MCISCIIRKQEKLIRDFSDEDKKSQYINRVLEILHKHGQAESSPWLAEKINQLYEECWCEGEDYTVTKQRYNQLLMSKEKEILSSINNSDDCIRECIKYVSAGNYIDFSAVDNVNEHTLDELLQKVNEENISEIEYFNFKRDLEQAKKLVYLTDNCGEILLDKIFIKCIEDKYPKLKITVIVRGQNVINDATIEDAKQVGLTDIVTCVGNGNGAPGTVIKLLSEEAKQTLLEADMIISKGQGNFESLFGEGLNPYYIFLCKCELFVRRFGLQQYESVFMKEERIKENWICEGEKMHE